MLFAFVVGHDEWMTRSESFLLKVQGGSSMSIVCLGWRWRMGTETGALKTTAAGTAEERFDGCRRHGHPRRNSMSDVWKGPPAIRSAKPWTPFEFRAVRSGIS